MFVVLKIHHLETKIYFSEEVSKGFLLFLHSLVRLSYHHSLSSYEVDKPVVTQSTSMEQWLGCSAANLKVVGSIPVVAVTFWWRRNGRGPCIVWCNCRLKNTECSCIPWLRLLQDEKKFVNVMQLKHGKNSAICSIITGLLLVEKIEVAFINLVPKY